MAWAEREAENEGISVSNLVTAALVSLREQRRAKRERDEAWAEWMTEYEAKHGVITDEEDLAAAHELGFE